MTYGSDIVSRVIMACHKKVKIKDIANQFKISERTIYNWRQLYSNINTQNNLKEIKKIIDDKPNNRIEYKCILTNEIKNYIEEYIKNNQLITAKKFRKHLKRKFKINICRDIIYKWFNKLGITYKKVNSKKIFVCKKKEKLLKELNENIKNISDKNDIVSIDESHFEINMYAKNGRNIKGNKIYK